MKKALAGALVLFFGFSAFAQEMEKTKGSADPAGTKTVAPAKQESDAGCEPMGCCAASNGEMASKKGTKAKRTSLKSAGVGVEVSGDTPAAAPASAEAPSAAAAVAPAAAPSQAASAAAAAPSSAPRPAKEAK